MTNLDIFQKFREYQSRKVDNPNYEPLGQTILKPELSEEELKKQKAREYSKRYYEEHKEERKEYYRNYHKKNGQMEKEYGLKWIQLRIYKYLLEYHNKWHDLPRWTKIARDLNLNLQSVYNTMFQLIKKWYASRWAIWKYYLVNIPESEEAINEVIVEENPEMIYVEEDKYDWLVDENTDLMNENAWLRSKIEELEEYIKWLEEKSKWLEEQVNNSVWHIDWLINSNTELEKKNIDLLHQIEELKWVIKILFKYFW